MLQEIGSFIKEVGFPVAVASFVLFRMNGKFDRLSDTIERLIQRMDRHAEERRKGDG